MRLSVVLLQSFLGILLTALSINAVAALSPAQKLIQKMGESAQQLNYEGFFVYERGQQSTSYQIVHVLEDQMEKQRLVFLDGPPLEVISDGHSLTCIHPGNSSFTGSTHSADFESVSRLSKVIPDVWEYYNAQLSGEARIAGRMTQVIKMLPKDQHRYPYVFFVDKETGLMLKMLILDAKGNMLERFHYVSISYDQVTEDDLKPQISNYTVVDHSMMEGQGSSKDIANKNQWKLTWMPRGFKQEKTQMQSWEQGVKHSGQAFMYSDGMSAFSVFVDGVAAKSASRGISSRIGSTSAVSHYIQEAGRYYAVTVVGEIPLMTAKQIAASVRSSVATQ